MRVLGKSFPFTGFTGLTVRPALMQLPEAAGPSGYGPEPDEVQISQGERPEEAIYTCKFPGCTRQYASTDGERLARESRVMLRAREAERVDSALREPPPSPVPRCAPQAALLPHYEFPRCANCPSHLAPLTKPRLACACSQACASTAGRAIPNGSARSISTRPTMAADGPPTARVSPLRMGTTAYARRQ